jgi:hypothetical protein
MPLEYVREAEIRVVAIHQYTVGREQLNVRGIREGN